MPNRYYSSTAVATHLADDVAVLDTTITVEATTGFPASYPYTLVLEENPNNQEVVTVTAGVGLVLTVTRGEDGTTARIHANGANVIHGVSARDYAEPQALLASTAAAWTTFTPSLTAVSGGLTLTSSNCAYQLIGKTLHLRFSAVINAVGSGVYALTLPASLTAQAGQRFAIFKQASGSGAIVSLTSSLVGATLNFAKSTGVSLSAGDVTTGDTIGFNATIEVV